MSRPRKDRSVSPMDALVIELMTQKEGTDLVDLCLSESNFKTINAVPVRYRLICLAFLQGLSPDELNARLEEEHCEKLYLRNYWEASVYYALQSGLNYEQWGELRKEASQMYERAGQAGGFFAHNAISLEEIRAYINLNSKLEEGIPVTQSGVTRYFESSIKSLSGEGKEFLRFISMNLNAFSDVREKTRYYFCKYLMYYAEACKMYYYEPLRRGEKDLPAFDARSFPEVSPFRVKTDLVRHSYDREDLEKRIDEAPISPRVIYEAYESYYYGYVSIDWVETLLEGDMEEVSPSQRRAIADVIREKNPGIAGLSDDDAIEWMQMEIERREDLRLESPDGEKSQVGRVGEAFLRDVIKGRRDLDRTTLISFLMFFERSAGSCVPERYRLSVERLNEILRNCGFHRMDPRDEADDFFLSYMRAENPVDFLIEEAESLAMSASNFYLYKTYIHSKSIKKQWDVIARSEEQ